MPITVDQATIDLANSYTNQKFTELKDYVVFNYYTKSTIDNMLQNLSQTVIINVDNNINNILQDYYTKNEIDNMFSNYYDKNEIDNISQSLSNYYNKSEIDAFFNINNMSNDPVVTMEYLRNNYYSKQEVDTLLSNYYTLEEVNQKLLQQYDDLLQYFNNILSTMYYNRQEFEIIKNNLTKVKWDNVTNKPILNIKFTGDIVIDNSQQQVSIDLNDVTSYNQNIPIIVLDNSHEHNNTYYTKSEVDNFLNNKANVTHNHDTLYYTKTYIINQLAQKSDITHDHNEIYFTKTEITDLLNQKSNIHHDHSSLYYEKSYINDALNQKANINHNHDDRYYTKTTVDTFFNSIYTIKEMDQLLLNYSDINHNHDDRYYTKDDEQFISNLITP